HVAAISRSHGTSLLTETALTRLGGVGRCAHQPGICVGGSRLIVVATSSSSDSAQRRRGSRRSSDGVRQALLQSAALMFARHGYAGASTKDIAAAAETSETVIYRHFGSKAELFAASVTGPFIAFLDEYTAEFKRDLAVQRDDYRLLKLYIEKLYDHFSSQRNNILALISASGDPEAEEAVRAAVARMNQMFNELYGLSAELWTHGGGFPLSRAKLWHRLIAGMVVSITALDPLFLPDGWQRPARQEIIETVTDLFLHGLYGEDPSKNARGDRSANSALR
ncbi:MAG: TetR family transcriptional regulator, partial [Actinobacteria bacterium]|nr:TetR family transcriptional regulator [Actinomycetota bacterium]